MRLLSYDNSTSDAMGRPNGAAVEPPARRRACSPERWTVPTAGYADASGASGSITSGRSPRRDCVEKAFADQLTTKRAVPSLTGRTSGVGYKPWLGSFFGGGLDAYPRTLVCLHQLAVYNSAYEFLWSLQWETKQSVLRLVYLDLV